MDTLPPQVQFLSLAYPTNHVASASYDSGSHTVTFTFHSPLESGATGELRIDARFPSGTWTGVEALNNATMDADTGLTNSVASSPADVRVVAANGSSPPVIEPGVRIRKSDNTDAHRIGGGAYFTIYHGTLGEQQTNYVIEEQIPPDVIFEVWNHDKPFLDELFFTVNYRTTLNGTWQPWPGGPFSTDESSANYAISLGLAAGEYVTALQFDFGTVPAGYNFHYDVGARIVVRGDFTTMFLNGQPNDQYGNPVVATNPPSTSTNVVTLVTDQASDSSTTVTEIVDAEPLLDVIKTFVGNEGPFNPGDIIRFRVVAQNPPESAGDVHNPTLWDLLPPELEYAGNLTVEPNWSDGSNLIPTGGSLPNVEAFPNWDGTGRTLLKFWWDETNPLTLKHTTTYSEFRVDFDTLVRWDTPNGTYTNIAVGTVTNLDAACEFGSDTRVDQFDYDEDGDRTETFCAGSEKFEVYDNGSAVGLDAQKWVIGQCDTNWSRFPETGQTVPGGRADYQLRIANPSALAVKDIVIVDILPHVGDTGVVDLNQRLSEWRPVLAGPVAVNGVLPAGITNVTIHYSTSDNPERDELTPGVPIDAEPANWSTTPPADITTVSSLKFELDGTLDIGETLILEWPMRAPLNAPVNGEIAWNSFGYTAKRADDDSQLLASEPIKVGITTKAGNPGYYGDRVWYDTNRDGIQDPGEVGINGVRVDLYIADGATPDPDNDTLWGFTVTQSDGTNDGHYLFSELPPTNYYAVFYPPAGHTASPADQGGDDAADSDGVAGTVGGTPVRIVPVTSIEASEVDRTWDQGFYDDSALTIGDRVWLDTTPNDLQDSGEAGIPGVTVELYDMSDGGTLVGDDVTDANGFYIFGGAFNQNMRIVTNDIAVTTCVMLEGNANSVEERGSTKSIDVTSSDLELGTDGGGYNTVGIRFLDLPMPQGATILSADIQFTSDDDNSVDNGVTNNESVIIVGHDHDDSPVFNTADGSLTGDGAGVPPLDQTSASVTWSVPPWGGNSITGPNQLTPNLSSIVQEIVDRPGWQAGNDMSFLVLEHPSFPNAEREAGTSDDPNDTPPMLCVTYAQPVAVRPSLVPGHEYEVRVATNQAPLSGLSLVATDAGGDSSNDETTDVVDSDAVLSGAAAVIDYTAGPTGTYNMGLDFGFSGGSLCAITNLGLRVACDDNGTADAADDLIEVYLNPTGTGTSGTYSVSGAITSGGVPYGVETLVGTFPAGGGDVTITVTDDGDAGCSTSVSVTDSGPCSAPEIDLVVAHNIECGETGGTFVVEFSGGTGPYQVDYWRDGDPGNVINYGSVTGSPAILSGLTLLPGLNGDGYGIRITSSTGEADQFKWAFLGKQSCEAETHDCNAGNSLTVETMVQGGEEGETNIFSIADVGSVDHILLQVINWTVEDVTFTTDSGSTTVPGEFITNIPPTSTLAVDWTGVADAGAQKGVVLYIFRNDGGGDDFSHVQPSIGSGFEFNLNTSCIEEDFPLGLSDSPKDVQVEMVFDDVDTDPNDIIEIYLEAGGVVHTGSLAVVNAGISMATYTATLSGVPGGATTLTMRTCSPYPDPPGDSFGVSGLVINMADICGPAALGDFVWHDIDQDGMQDASEPGIDGVTVRLLGAATNVLETTQTAGGGFYIFTNLVPGTYLVEFVLPPGYDQFTGHDRLWVDDALDSDAVPVNSTEGRSGPVTLSAGETNLTIDAGVHEPECDTAVRLNFSAEGFVDGVSTLQSFMDVAGTGVDVDVEFFLVDSSDNILGNYDDPANPNVHPLAGESNGEAFLEARDIDTTSFPGAGRILARVDFSVPVLANDIWLEPFYHDVARNRVKMSALQAFSPAGASLTPERWSTYGGAELVMGIQPATALPWLISVVETSVDTTWSGAYEIDYGDQLVSRLQYYHWGVLPSDNHTNGPFRGPLGSTFFGPPQFCAAEVDLALGNLVFLDNNANGLFDAGDVGVTNVAVELWSAGADGIAGTADDAEVLVGPDGVLGTADDAAGGTVTSNGGSYLFTELSNGVYFVRIPASEFQAGGPLEGLRSSFGWSNDDLDDDVGENGIDTFQPDADGVVSPLVTLSVGTEPSESGYDGTADDTVPGDASGNLTVDFGFIPECSEYRMLLGEFQPVEQVLEFPFPLTDGSNTMPVCGTPALGGEALVVDEGNQVIYSATQGNGIQMYDVANGTVQTFFNTYTVWYGMTMAPVGDYIYGVSGTKVVRIPIPQTPLATHDAEFDFAGIIPADSLAWGVAVNPMDGNVYVTTGLGNPTSVPGRVYVLPPDLSGPPTLIATSPVNVFYTGIEFMPDGTFWVAGHGFSNTPDRLVHYEADGTFIEESLISLPPTGAVEGYAPFDLALGPDGNLYVALLNALDYPTGASNVHCVLQFDPDSGTMVDYLRGPPGSGAKGIEFSCLGLACAEIGDRVWYDLDGDGIQDASETGGVAGVTVYLLDSGGSRIATNVTDSSGLYVFSGVFPGDYRIEFDLGALPNGYIVTVQGATGSSDPDDSDADTATGITDLTTLTGGESDLTWDMGLLPLLGIGDFVWEDLDADGIQDAGEPGISNVTVCLYHSDGTPVTITNVATFADDFETGGFGGNTGSTNFNGAWDELGGATVVDNGGDLMVELRGSNSGSGDSTERSFILPSWTEIVEVSFQYDADNDPSEFMIVEYSNLTGWVQLTAIESGTGIATFDSTIVPGLLTASAIRFSVSNANNNDRYYFDDLEIRASGLPQTICDTTDADGYYWFDESDGLVAGNDYQLRVDLSDAALTGLELSPQDAGGVTNDNPLTDNSDSDADNGVTAAGYATIVFTAPLSGQNPGFDFGFGSPAVTVGDTVWIDVDADGIQDASETTGVAGVTVVLYDSNSVAVATQQTDSAGMYLFSDLDPGAYYVVFDPNTIPTGLAFTLQDVGADDAVDSDADPVTGQTASTPTLLLGQSDLTLDAGLVLTVVCPSNAAAACDASTHPDDTGYAVSYSNTPTWADTVVAGACAHSYTIQRTWTASNALLGVATCIQEIAVSDTEAPTIVCPGDVTVECDADLSPANTGNPVVGDNCDTSPAVGYADTTNAGACADAFTITRTWTVTDACGHTDSCTQTITVVDTTAPALSGVPADTTVECDSVPGPASPTATDNCDASPGLVLVATTNVGSCADSHTIVRTWTATDACGNQTVASQVVTVADTTPPSLACPADLTLTGAVGSCEITVPSLTPVLSDNCDGAPALAQSPPAGTIVAGPTNLDVVLTATDACGNSSVCTTLVTVVCPPCDIFDVAVVTNCSDEGTGDPLDDTFSVQITVTGTNVTTFSVSGDATASGLAYGVQHTILSGALITNGAVNFTITDDGSANSACSTNLSVNPPPACSACGITEVLVSTVCDDAGTGEPSDDTFSVYVYATGTDVYTYAVSGDLSATGLSYGVSNLLATGLLISAGDLSINLADEVGGCASNGIPVNAPSPCSACAITSVVFLTECDDAGTPSPTDDTFSVSVVALGSGVTSYAVSGDLTAGGLAYGSTNLIASGLSIAAGDLTVSITEEAGSCSSNNLTITPPPACPYSEVGDYVWYDVDNDGVQDATETNGVEGVTVVLYNSGGPVATNTTDATGHYLFTDLPADDYYVVFDPATLPAGTSFSPQDQGGDDALDSDADPVTGTSGGTGPLAPGGTDYTLDAGVYIPAAVGDYVWIDTDGDGIQDAGESTGVPGVTVVLYDSNGPVATNVTDADGLYLFTNLPPETYHVVFDPNTLPAGYVFTAPNQGGDDAVDSDADTGTGQTPALSVPGGTTNLTFDAGILQLAHICGSVFRDEDGDGVFDAVDTNGLGGVTVTLLDSTGAVVAVTTTAADGSYNFSNVFPGVYTVVETDPGGYSSTGDTDGGDPNRIAVTVTSGQTSCDHDFLDTLPAMVSGTVTEDLDNDDTGDAPLVGVTIELWSDTDSDGVGDTLVTTTTTDAGGHYQFTNVAPGQYVVVETDPTNYNSVVDNDPSEDGDTVANTDSNDNALPVTLTAGEHDADNDFVDETLRIGDYVWIDLNQNGLQDAGEAPVAGVEICAWIPERPPSQVAATNNPADILLDGAPVAISSTMTVPAIGGSLTNVTLSFDWTLNNSGGGPTEPDNSFDLEMSTDGSTWSVVKTYASDDASGSDSFSYTNPAYPVSFRLVKNAGDNGDSLTLSSIAVVASGEQLNPEQLIACDTTDGSGYYGFTSADGLPASTEIELRMDLGQAPVSNLNLIVADQGGDDLRDSDAVETNGIALITLTTPDGGGNLSYDFGFEAPYVTVGDTVWIDVDADGIQDASETTGVAGVTVVLYDTNATAIATQQTDSAGMYLFTNLNPGAYYVVFDPTTIPIGLEFTVQNAGTNDVIDSDADTSTGQTASTPALLGGQADLTLDAGLVLTVICPSNVAAACDASTHPDDTGYAVSYSNTPTWADTVVAGACAHSYTIQRTWTASNALLGVATCVQEIAVSDSVAPVITCPADATNQCDNLSALATTPTVSDNCDTNPSVSYADTTNVGACANAYTITRVWTATDACGNAASCTQQVTVVDTTAPFFTGMASNTTAECDNIPALVSPKANDTCDPNPAITLVITTNAGSCADSYTIVRTWTATDACSNQTVASQVVTVVDTSPPSITCPADLTLTGSVASCEITVPSLTPVLSDNCDGAPALVQSPPAGTIVAGPTNLQVVLTAIDACSNSASCTARITVVCRVQLGDFVWEDLDYDGLQEAGEPGVPNVTVVLSDTNGPIATQQTDSAGAYLFTNLPPGTYSVRFIPPDGYLITHTDAGTDDLLDSDGLTPPSVTLVSGEDLSLDLGLYQPVSLGDLVWEDLDGDGIQDLNEPGISNVVVVLSDTNGPVATQLTDSAGLYLFTNLPPAGTYSVTFTPPAGYAVSPSDQGGDDALDSDGLTPPAVTLAPGEEDRTLDLGLYQPVIVGDFVWEDLDADGVQEAGEPGISNVVVVLSDTNGPVATQTTDSAGLYLFTNLPPGTYSVTFTDPAGYTATAVDAGGDDTLDSDANPTPTTTLASGESDLTLDQGYYLPVRIGDFVWEDLDGDGIQDVGEPGISNVVVVLSDSNGPIATQTTDSAGAYLFTNLLPGTYSVTFTAPDGYTVSPTDQGGDDEIDSDGLTPPSITLASGEEDLSLDLGLYTPVRVGDLVWEDLDADGIQDGGEPGISNVVVVLSDTNGPIATQTTDGAGLYLFTNLPPGTYSVTFTAPAGYTVSPSDQGGDDALDSDGLTPPSTTLASGEEDLSLDLGLYRPVGLGDLVWEDLDGDGIQDAGEPGVSNVVVVLSDTNGPVATQLTDSAGLYLFTNLPPGTYSVTFTAPAGYTVSPTDQGGDDALDSDGLTPPAVTLAPGEEDRTLDLGLYQPVTVGDFVWEDLDADGIQEVGEPGVSNVVVVLSDTNGPVATQTTDSAGLYLFTNLPPGTYSVTFTDPAGYTATAVDAGGDDTLDSDANPTPTTTLASGESDLTLDQGYYLPVRIGDFVWDDLDADGIQDGGEPGISNVVVVLSDTNGPVATQLTDSAGLYLFTNLPPGTYSVTFTAPAGYVVSPSDQGGDDAIDSGGLTPPAVTLASGEEDLSLDLGLYRPVGLGDLVWEDLDGDGIQDAGEPGVSNVVVVLSDTNGPVATQLTDSAGLYLFTNLPPGTYSVTFTAPAGYTVSPTDQGGDDEFDSDGLTPPAVTLGPDEQNLTLDLGLYRPVTVGDFVWEDLNADGIQDGGEPGISNVVVVLSDTSGPIATQTTDSAGLYLFTNLPPGTYSVTFTDPAGYTVTSVDAGGDDALDSDANPTPTTTLASGESDLTLDQGYYLPAQIGDLVWEDLNGDGIQDAGEPGISNVVVVLSDTNGPIATQLTDSAGAYLFTNLPPGEYSVTFTVPDGYTVTPSDQGGDDAADSDGLTPPPTTLVSGGDDLSIDLGLYRPVAVGDFVWEDLDTDGVQDAGEPGISNVTVVLNDGSGPVATQTTDSAGLYLFTNLPPGTYSVSFVDPTGYTATTTDAGGNDALDSDPNPTPTTTLASGESDLSLDRGYVAPILIGDLMWEDLDADGIQDAGEPGIGNVTVCLYHSDGTPVTLTNVATFADDFETGGFGGNTGTTNFNGGWAVSNGADVVDNGGDLMANLPGRGGSNGPEAGFERGFTLPGWATTVTVSFDYEAQGDDAAETMTAEYFDGVGWVQLAVFTNGSGTASFDSSAVPGLLDASAIRFFVSADTDANDDFYFDDLVITVEGTPQEVCTVTDADGFYWFDEADGLVAGNDYQLRVDLNDAALTGMELSPRDAEGVTNNHPVEDTSDSDADDGVTASGYATILLTTPLSGTNPSFDFGFFTPSVTIGDYVWIDEDGDGVQDASETNGVAGVQVVLYDTNGTALATNTTDASGHYLFTGLPSDDYYVVFEPDSLPSNMVFTVPDQGGDDALDSDANPTNGQTASTGYLSGISTNLTLDAGLYEPVRVGDFVWEDLDGDGVQDAGEPGISNVVVVLSDTNGPIATQTTDSAGLYLFTNLPPGTYSVIFTDPVGYVATSVDAGGDDTLDSDPNPTPTTTLASGESDLTLDQGYYSPASLGDLVWFDLNQDGVQDGGEPGVEGVVIRLYDASTNLVATQTTDVDGAYVFVDLPPGTYVVEFDESSLPSGTEFTTPDQGGDDTLDSDADLITGQTPEVTLSSGQSNLTLDAGIVCQGLVLTCPTNVVIECGDDTSTNATGVATATSLCGCAVTVTHTNTSTAGCGNTETISRIWTATDACGNSVSCTQTITVVDATAPVITCPSDLTLACTDSTNVADTGTATAIDDCDTNVTVSFADTVTPGTCAAESTIERVWTATDDCGNASVCTQTLSIVDSDAPVITCPSDLILACTDSTNTADTGTATAIDDCDTNVTVSFADTVTPGTCPAESTIERVWTATDDCGNSAVCTQTIDVVDSDAPVITCPSDLTLACTDSTNTADTGVATAIDDCDTNVTVSFIDTVIPGTCPAERSIERVWTATDDCGNRAVCTQTIEVIDSDAPSIVCPSDAVLGCLDSTNVASLGTASAMDVCDTNVAISFTDTVTPGTCAAERSIERVWTATDDCGNASVCTQLIEVIDSDAPSIVCPADAVLGCLDSTNVASLGTASAMDVCDTNVAVSFADTVTPGTCAAERSIERVWTATDDCGNRATCTQTIEVIDSDAPSIVCPSDAVLGCIDSTNVASLGTASAMDVCDTNVAVSFADTVTPGTCPAERSIERVWTATDDCGNSATCTQLIEVIDSDAPSIVCPADAVLGCLDSTNVASLGTASAMDVCDTNVAVSFADTVTPGTCAAERSIERVWTATDDCGNSATCTQLIEVIDSDAPSIVCPADAVLGCLDSTNVASLGTASAMDVCDTNVAVSFADTVTPGTCRPSAASSGSGRRPTTAATAPPAPSSSKSSTATRPASSAPPTRCSAAWTRPTWPPSEPPAPWTCATPTSRSASPTRSPPEPVRPSAASSGCGRPPTTAATARSAPSSSK